MLLEIDYEEKCDRCGGPHFSSICPKFCRNMVEQPCTIAEGHCKCIEETKAVYGD